MPQDAKLNFSLAEYDQRLSKPRAAMTAKNIDCLIVVDPSNMAWLSGYDGWSFYTHQCLIVQHDAEPVWWGRGIDAPGALRTTYLEPDNILKYPDHFVQSDSCHPMDHLSTVLRNMNLSQEEFDELAGEGGIEMKTRKVGKYEALELDIAGVEGVLGDQQPATRGLHRTTSRLRAP